MTDQPTNLTVHREGPSVWDRQASVVSRERFMSMLGVVMLATGACLLVCANRARLSTTVKSRVRSALEHVGHDSVSAELKDSFPASDPPSWTPAVGKTAHAAPRLT